MALRLARAWQREWKRICRSSCRWIRLDHARRQGARRGARLVTVRASGDHSIAGTSDPMALETRRATEVRGKILSSGISNS